MRSQRGCAVRFIVIVGCFVVTVPIIFLSKLETIHDRSRHTVAVLHYPGDETVLRTPERPDRVANVILQPMMSYSLGNYEPDYLPLRTGEGEGGAAVILSASENRSAQETIKDYGFNMIASDKISLDRRINDTRPAECRHWIYPDAQYLPTASVIVVFCDEGWSVLVRTVHSVINTSPPKLLKEIVLVDDGSIDTSVVAALETYISRWNGLVKLYRTGKRVGLIQARTLGAQKSIGDVIVILDAHCECVINWLPPLLTRIALNRKALAVPIVDGLEWNTLEHKNIYGSASFRGIWEWGFLYKETQIPAKELKRRNHSSEPYWSPTHAGGLLAIDRRWFFELGAYDPGILVWGAEQYELSFKVWQCGGVVEWVPCSHVAHAYRGPRTHSSYVPDSSPHQTTINHLRLAHVWMDEYVEYFYRREPATRTLNYGDVAERRKLRERLQCRSFKWFMETIAYDVLRQFPPPSKNVVWGECTNAEYSVCLHDRDAEFGQPIGVAVCYGQRWLNKIFDRHLIGLKIWRLNEEGELSSGEHCFVSYRRVVKKQFCLNAAGRWNPVGEWQWNDTTQQIRSRKANLCMDTNGTNLSLAVCDEHATSQKWTWKEFHF